MNKRLLLRRLSIVPLLLLLYLLAILFIGWLNDWQPEEGPSPITPTQSSVLPIVPDTILRFVIWNVGYAGLGAESDFFFDDEGIWYSGSSMVRSPKDLVEKNLHGATKFLRDFPADFFLLQEVDVTAKRSHYFPQYDMFAQALPEFAATFAANYQCDRVPIPLLEPWNAYGKVLSGLGTYSRFQPVESVRYQLPGKYPMPDRIFQLDRCAALHRYKVNNGKELIVINIHNAAHDPADKIKAIQLPYLRDLALSEFEKGNYVVLGGDWNQCPPNFRFDAFMPGKTQGYKQGNIPPNYFPEGWVWGYDPTVPTNRKTRDPYSKGQTFETLIDFFLVSPNVQLKTVKGVNQEFQYSDHQPVWMEVKLMELN